MNPSPLDGSFLAIMPREQYLFPFYKEDWTGGRWDS